MGRGVLLRGESDPGRRKGKSAYLMRMPIILSTEDNNNEAAIKNISYG